MAEIVAPVVSQFMEKLGELIFAKVKRQFIYLCCFNSNIESLREEAEKLKNETSDLQRRVDAVIRNTDDASVAVEAWLNRSDEIQVDVNGIEDEIKNVKSGCLAIKSRFSLSRKARKKADTIEVHRKLRGNFTEISVPALPPSMAPIIPQVPSDEFNSRKQIEEEIMEDLRGGKVHMMGICGMGGVGKTTMAERIMDRVRGEKLFEEVVKIVISQKVNESEIQREIAENFGVKFEEKSLSARANKLHKRLTDATRKLLILDDIWEELDLKNLGIPCKSDEGAGCTMLITSRNREVLRDMNAKPFGVQILSPEEALLLFRGKIGTCSEPEKVLKQVVEECEGLPLALVTVGAALRDKSTENWNDALRKLRSSDPNIPKVLKKVYEPIKVSYDFLDDPDAKSLFLLCCIFPEDYDINLEYLTIYGMGLSMFTGEIATLEEARDSLRVLVGRLKSCFLLLEGSDKDHVKMHDVVRDVAIYIATKERRIVGNSSLTASRVGKSINCEWISVVGKETNKLKLLDEFTCLSFPSLRLLNIVNYSAQVGINNSSFFQGTVELNVLFLRGIPFRSLPETTQLLKNLHTLYLEDCFGLETISIVGELLSLEILICRTCHGIAELPVEIGGLKQLRMLEVKDCERLTRIAPGVISSLVQLEELIIVNSFDGWETKANGELRKNAALCEIEHLEKLTRLEIEIENVILATEEIRFHSKILKFDVTVGGREYSFDYLPYENTMIVVAGDMRIVKSSWSAGRRKWKLDGVPYEGKMSLVYKGDITFGKWIHVFLTSTEYLRAEGEGANNLDISSQAQNMKGLILGYCSNVNKLRNVTPSMDWSVGVFPLLESLKLYALPNLEEIFVGPIQKSSNYFRNLKELHLVKLPALEQVWKCPHQNVSLGNLTSMRVLKCSKLRKLCSITKDGLLQLEKLQIEECEMMERVFDKMDREECDEITFPNLKSLELSSLSSLISFCKGSQSIEFPLLQRIFIEKCGKLKSLSCSIGDSRNLAEQDDSFQVFFNQKVTFDNLMEINISGCEGIRSLFSSSTAENSVKLKTLRINKCRKMVKVIEDEDDVLCEKQRILFPCLENLCFFDLPNLEEICVGTIRKASNSFGKLKELHLRKLPALEQLWKSPHQNVPLDNLTAIFVRECSKLRKLFSLSISKDGILQLETLKIEKCEMMEHVFFYRGQSEFGTP